MRVELRSDLNQRAARMAAPMVERLTHLAAREARSRAPRAHVWVTVDDERVRPAHVEADGQAIPGNLRFKLTRQVYVRGSGRGGDASGRTLLVEGQYVLAREPRDGSLPPDQREGCRCVAVEVPDLIARKIQTGPVMVQGMRVSGQVWVRFNRIVEAHTGTSGDRPDRFMSQALAAAGRTLRRAGKA